MYLTREYLGPESTSSIRTLGPKYVVIRCMDP